MTFYSSSEGMAVHTLVLIVIFGFMVFTMLMVFSGYLKMENCEINGQVCQRKIDAYCVEWWKNGYDTGKKPDWESVEICSNSGVMGDTCDPPSRSECMDQYT